MADEFAQCRVEKWDVIHIEFDVLYSKRLPFLGPVRLNIRSISSWLSIIRLLTSRELSLVHIYFRRLVLETSRRGRSK